MIPKKLDVRAGHGLYSYKQRLVSNPTSIPVFPSNLGTIGRKMKQDKSSNTLKPTHVLCSKCGEVKHVDLFRHKKLNYGKVSNYYTYHIVLQCEPCRKRKTPVSPTEYREKLHKRGLPHAIVDMMTEKRIQRGKKQKTESWRRTIANQTKEKYDAMLVGLNLEQKRVNNNLSRVSDEDIKVFLLRYKDILSVAKKSARVCQREAKQPLPEWSEYISEEHKQLLYEKHDELHQRLDMSRVRPSWIIV